MIAAFVSYFISMKTKEVMEKYGKSKLMVEEENASPVCFAESPEIRPEYLDEPDDMPETSGNNVRDSRDCDM